MLATKDKHKLPKEHHSSFPATLNSTKLKSDVFLPVNPLTDARNSPVTPKAPGCYWKHSLLLLRLVYTQRFLLTECN